MHKRVEFYIRYRKDMSNWEWDKLVDLCENEKEFNLRYTHIARAIPPGHSDLDSIWESFSHQWELKIFVEEIEDDR